MLLTVNAELPVLLMVIVAVAVAPVVTLPNAKLPVTPMMRVAVTTPLWVAVKVLPAIVTVPVRELLLVLAATVTVTEPLPLPLVGETLSHAALELDVHFELPFPDAVMLTGVVPPDEE
jgi:hypothetical protein